MADFRLREQQYTEADYFFKTIEMAKSDEEFEELCTPKTPTLPDFTDLEPSSSAFSWKVVKRRKKPHRRYTVSNYSPPAPPSTPTSLTASGTPSSNSPTASSNDAATDERRLSSLLYILDYAPKYKKKRKEQQRTDAELAGLFDGITITGGHRSRSSGGIASAIEMLKKGKTPPERGISTTSRTIRRRCNNVFKLHHSSNSFLQDDNTPASAPEYDSIDSDSEVELETAYLRRWGRLPRRRRLVLKNRDIERDRLRGKERERYYSIQQHNGVEAMCDAFGTTMSINDA